MAAPFRFRRLLHPATPQHLGSCWLRGRVRVSCESHRVRATILLVRFGAGVRILSVRRQLTRRCYEQPPAPYAVWFYLISSFPFRSTAAFSGCRRAWSLCCTIPVVAPIPFDTSRSGGSVGHRRLSGSRWTPFLFPTALLRRECHSFRTGAAQQRAAANRLEPLRFVRFLISFWFGFMRLPVSAQPLR